MTKYNTLLRLSEMAQQSIHDVLPHELHDFRYIGGAVQFDKRTDEFKRNSEIANVPVADLHPTQENYDDERIHALPDQDIDDHLPLVIDYDGEMVLFDGHHRAARAITRGEPTFRAIVVHIKRIYFDDDLDLIIEYQN